MKTKVLKRDKNLYNELLDELEIAKLMSNYNHNIIFLYNCNISKYTFVDKTFYVCHGRFDELIIEKHTNYVIITVEV